MRQFEHQHNNTEFLQVVDNVIRLFKRLRAAARAKEEQDDQEDQEESSASLCLYTFNLFWYMLALLTFYRFSMNAYQVPFLLRRKLCFPLTNTNSSWLLVWPV